MTRTNGQTAHHRAWALGVATALVAAVALVLTPFGSAQGMALAALATPTETSVPSATPSTTAIAVPTAGEVTVGHHVLARIEGADFRATYLPVDAPMLNASQTQSFRVRFQVSNTGTGPVTAIPQLEYRPDGGDGFIVVPEKAQQGIALQAAREQVRSLTNLAWEPGPLGEDIAVGELRIPSAGGALAVSGHHSMGANPDVPITLPAGSYTEQEFTVRLTADARYLTGYELRITDGGTPLTGSPVAKIRVGPPPPADPPPSSPLPADPPTSTPLPADPPPSTPPPAVPPPSTPLPAVPPPSTPLPAVPPPSTPLPAVPPPSTPLPADPPPSTPLPADPVQGFSLDIPAATSGTGAAYPLAKPSADAALLALGADTSSGAVTPAAAGPNELLYGLAASTTSLAAAAIGPTPHGPYTAVADECATCHRTHTGKNNNLLKSAPPQSNLCFSCHDGTGASTDVKGQFTDPAVPQNDNTNRLYYRHDTIGTTAHTSAGANEFDKNAVPAPTRHSECGDCHNPHKANAANSTDGTPAGAGATASGRLAGVSGVSVANGAAGTAPAYTFLDGKTPATSIAREYQLCFKCHSGFTTLPPPITGQPSKDYLDKAVEFNPANPSFHPVEAKGTNATAKMQLSLDGGSVWKLKVDSTIRCSNCHASSTKYPLTPPSSPNADLPPHTSQYRGILLRNYQDRELKSGSAAYNNDNFALCFMCHSNTPFATETGGNGSTNFSKHGYHTTRLDQGGTAASANIDTSGAGRGNALCAECHFRLHGSTKDMGGTQTLPGSRLVNFAPNVSGPRTWNKTTGGGSCTLTCHGKPHNSGMSY